MYRALFNKISNLLEYQYETKHPNSTQSYWSKKVETFKLFMDGIYDEFSFFYYMSTEQKNQLLSDNKNTLEKKFAEIYSANNYYSTQKVAEYLVSIDDHSGVFFRNIALLNHFYEIKNLQAHGYTVYPRIIDNLYQIVIRSHENTELLYINAHGNSKFLTIDYFDMNHNLTLPSLKQGADIVLISCSTGEGLETSIASKLAKDNPGANVFGAQNVVSASNIVLASKENKTFVENVEYQALPSPFENYMHKFNFIVDTTSNSDVNIQNEINLAGNIDCDALFC